MVWQPELFNILNLGSGISIKRGFSMHNTIADVIKLAESFRATLKSSLVVSHHVVLFQIFRSALLRVIAEVVSRRRPLPPHQNPLHWPGRG